MTLSLSRAFYSSENRPTSNALSEKFLLKLAGPDMYKPVYIVFFGPGISDNQTLV